MRRSALAVAMLVSSAAHAAPPGPRDPDWPCQQIKVPNLSLASVWSGPAVDPQTSTWKDDPQVANLVSKLTPRREELEQAGKMIHDFGQYAGDQKAPKLLQVLAGIYSVLDAQRDSVITGLDRFGGRQKELASEIRSDNEMLHSMQSDPAADPNSVQQMTEKVKWEAEVFQDRRQAISYACDAPTKIEQRLFALARMIQQELE